MHHGSSFVVGDGQERQKSSILALEHFNTLRVTTELLERAVLVGSLARIHSVVLTAWCAPSAGAELGVIGHVRACSLCAPVHTRREPRDATARRGEVAHERSVSKDPPMQAVRSDSGLTTDVQPEDACSHRMRRRRDGSGNVGTRA